MWIFKGAGTGGAPLPGPCTPALKIKIFVQDVPHQLSEQVPGCLPVASLC